MKNKFIISTIFFFLHINAFSEELFIEAKNISIDKDKQISIFENEVKVKTENNALLKSDYAEYNKNTGYLIMKNNFSAIDSSGNEIKAEYVEYNNKTKILKTNGKTKLITIEKYVVQGDDIVFDNNKSTAKSLKKTQIRDKDGNKIFLDNFDYDNKNNIFKSIGYIKIEDKRENIYEFSQIYIDTKKKEILGTDIKAYMNQENLKYSKENKPRVFANTIKLNKDKSSFGKSIFTLCNYRENDKCPPWTIQAKNMLHDSKKKTIYYDSALIKVYDLPIFYLPKLSHPDPTVDRRSGFLPPSILDTKNLGSGVSIPYFWAVSDDKNFTITNKLYLTENPLFMGEYHQAFKNSNFQADFGYTEGYKKATTKKVGGNKSHLFTKFIKNFEVEENNNSSLEVSLQHVSNDKYLKLYKIKSNLVNYNTDVLESSLKFVQEKENYFLGINAEVYETLKDSYEDKYEYILPEVTFDKNLLSDERFGSLDLLSSFKTHNYETNKLTNFFVNDFNFSSKDFIFESGLKGKFLSNIKNINYEAKNVEIYKNDFTSELFGSLGYFTEVNLQKISGKIKHYFKPKFLTRYSPGSMRKENDGFRLNPSNAFTLDRLNSVNNFETGLSSTLGFDYKFKSQNKELDFSVAQIINEKENKKMHSKSSLDEKLSDLVGSSSFNVNDKIRLNYNFALDQNYRDLNYNEIGTTLNLSPMTVDFNYLQEKNHIGNQEYFKTKIDLTRKENGLLSFETKRNLISNSSEFYNLSYEYINDCLRAGLVYRREFYTDSELEPENSLMFKITLTPFGNINSPSFSQ